MASPILPLSREAASGRKSRLAILALFFALFAILTIHLDFPLMKLADRSHVKGDLRRVIDLAEAFAFGPAAIVIALGVLLADRRSKWFTAKLFAYPIAAGMAVNVLKLGLPRLRPRTLTEWATLPTEIATGWDTFISRQQLHELSQGSSSDWQSFPSAHAATAVGLAIGLCRLYPSARGYFLTLAIFAGLQRIFAQAHYPSDVLAGAAVALFVCWLIERKAMLSLAIVPVRVEPTQPEFAQSAKAA